MATRNTSSPCRRLTRFHPSPAAPMTTIIAVIPKIPPHPNPAPIPPLDPLVIFGGSGFGFIPNGSAIVKFDESAITPAWGQLKGKERVE
ncbi:hypothetical protein BGZ96_009713 [Linnemannia gamsii]|uniref:Uncharacterized protein n=1 Tax=Linnemannia gamsii TaxID=64522 RepID=A0ABQ7KDH0_9FUNG|nr:hypothetical protein BGZ96_009713 [Linnemannia gamsii]